MANEIAAQDAAPGCAYIVADSVAAGIAPRYCGRPCRPGSAYCAAHHKLCHLRSGGAAEAHAVKRIAVVADVVGGRQARPAAQPPSGWVRRVESAVRPFLRPNSSRFVQSIEIAPPPAPGPTPERLLQGPVERPDQPIPDICGRPSRPYRAVDPLLTMQRRGSITAGMRQAGEDFRIRFAVARLDPLHAADPHHLRRERGASREGLAGPGLRIEAARAAVWQAVQAVGGIASPGGSCVWHVLGWEQTLKDWALGQGWSGRRVTQEAASGILIAALGALESHFTVARLRPPRHFSLDKSGSI